jgi:integrase
LDSENEKDLKEIVEDIEEELESFNATIPNRKLLPMPSDNDVVSTELDGKTPLSFVRDNEWVFRYGPKSFCIRLGQNIDEFGLYLSDPLAVPLRYFQTTLGYYNIPGKNPCSISACPNSMIGKMAELNRVNGYFYTEGYLLGEMATCKPVSSISVNVLRNLIEADMKAVTVAKNIPSEGNENLELKLQPKASKVIQFVYGLCAWAQISQLVSLPKEFKASFTAHDLLAGGLGKRFAQFKASSFSKWRAIEFDDLELLISHSLRYVETYSSNILFLRQKLSEIPQNLAKAEFAYKEPFDIHLYINRPALKPIIDEMLLHEFHKENGIPWFKYSISPGKSRPYIQKTVIIHEITNLYGSCIFTLLLWTAMRIDEFTRLTVNSLFIDGKRIDLKKDALMQVKNGKDFNIERVITKTAQGPRILPVPKVGALAFAILVELLRSDRITLNNLYLIPTGGIKFYKSESKRVFATDENPISNRTVRRNLKAYCEGVGVDGVHPHQCRKTLPTLLINQDPHCLELIREILCHKKIGMTLVYIMSLPGVTEDAMRYVMESELDSVVELMADAMEGKLAGAKGDEILEVVTTNQEWFFGETVQTTAKELIDSYVQSNFIIVRHPAAWCLRFPSKVPFKAPCLPIATERDSDDEIWPNPDRCIPWKCKYPVHTSKDLGRAKGNLAWANKSASMAKSASSKALYGKQAAYWETVVYQLEFGRPDIVALNLLEKSLMRANG